MSDEPQEDYLNHIVKKYRERTPHNKTPFKERIEYLEDFFESDTDKAIHNGVKETLAGDADGIHIEHHKDIKKMFDYNPGTHMAGKKKLASEKEGEAASEENKAVRDNLKSFLRKYMETVVSRYAAKRLSDLKEAYAGKEDELNKQIEQLYCNMFGVNEKRKPTSDANIEQLLESDYNTFTRTYDKMLERDYSNLSSQVINQITGDLIHTSERPEMVNYVNNAFKDNPVVGLKKPATSAEYEVPHLINTLVQGKLRQDQLGNLKAEQLEELNLEFKERKKEEGAEKQPDNLVAFPDQKGKIEADKKIAEKYKGKKTGTDN